MQISHSAKDKWFTCAYMYFLHYFMKLRPLTQNSALKLGSAVDEGLNILLLTRDLPAAIEKFESEWKKHNTDTAIKYSKADFEEHLVEKMEFKNQQEANWTSLLKKGRIFLEEYNAQVMPLIKRVIKIQIDEELDNGDGDTLVIKTDFIAEMMDGSIVLFDNKTSSVKYARDSVRNSSQLAIYFEGLKDQYKIQKCGYIVIPKKINKKKLPRVEISVIIDDISEETVEKTLAEYETALAGIKSGNFPKNEKSCYGIYGKCTYYDYCHKGSKAGLEEKKSEKR